MFIVFTRPTASSPVAPALGALAFVALAFVSSLGLAGCASSQLRDGPAADEVGDAPRDNLGGLRGAVVHDGRTGERLSVAEVRRRLAAARVVFVGEDHADPISHQAQLDVVRTLEVSGRRVAVGIEWLPASAQEAIDRFIAGQTTWANFLLESKWTERWGHHPATYRPVFQWAQARAVPIRALNLPPRVVRAIARGTVDALSPEDRALIPPLDKPAGQHKALFEYRMAQLAREAPDVAGPHAHAPSPSALERMHRAQLAWDEGMARALLGWLEGAPEIGVVAVLAGRGHVEHHIGVVGQLEAKDAFAGQALVIVPREPELDTPLVLQGAEEAWGPVADLHWQPSTARPEERWAP